MGNSNYGKTYYDGKLTNTTDKQKFLKLGSWEKFREVCTKGIDEMIRKNEGSKLYNAMGPSSASNTQIQSQDNMSVTYEECGQSKSK